LAGFDLKESNMGLLDSVLGGVLGQLGGGQHGEQAGGGLNPKMMMALGLLAMMAMRHKGQEADGGVASAGADAGAGGLGGLGGLGGVLGGLLGGAGAAGGGASAAGGLDLGSLLGGLLAARAAQAIRRAMGAAAGGIGALRDVLAQAGLGQQVDSWIGTGANQAVSASICPRAGRYGCAAVARGETGLSADDVAASLSEGLPELIDRLTPHGAVPPAA
jgi:uncharacterized protein YidB (DUF937 family)